MPEALKLPRGALKLATEALADAGLDRDAEPIALRALAAALGTIERAALKRAAERILLLEDLARGWRCPACHGKPASTPHLLERRTGYTCGGGHSWEPPKRPDYDMEPGRLLRRLARGEPLPELPDTRPRPVNPPKLPSAL